MSADLSANGSCHFKEKKSMYALWLLNKNAWRKQQVWKAEKSHFVQASWVWAIQCKDREES